VVAPVVATSRPRHGGRPSLAPSAHPHVAKWVHAVHDDHHAPDLWGEVAKERTISAAAERHEYEKPFSAAELKQLETALADIEFYITTTQPIDPPGKQKVRNRFAYLLDAAKKGARKVDWLNIFIAQIVALITTGVLVGSGNSGRCIPEILATLSS